jgi:hypothetical protein
MAKTRSPNFPYIPLETAIQRAQQVWDEEGRHDVAPETLVGHWGYSAKSSGGRQTLAAVRHFGLLEGRGDKVHLTDLAQAILFSEPESVQWLERVQEAALKPTIHNEIWLKYQGELVSDQNLRYYLVVERGFAESGAMELIRELKATLAFAKMIGADRAILSENDQDKSENENEIPTLTPPKPEDQKLTPPGGTRRAVQLPYSPTGWAALEASFPLSGDEWDQMLAVLTAMKPALTEASPKGENAES